MFYGQRLRIGREFREITQEQLGQRVVASPALISQYESGKKKEPARDFVKACGEVLGFTPGFFSVPLKDVFREEECNFRHRGTTAEGVKTKALAHATLIGFVIEALRSWRHFPPINVPKVTATNQEEIEIAAEHCRHHWKLAVDAPVLEIREVLESAGVTIVNRLVESKVVDTFSRYSATMAVIFPNHEIQTSSRWNFELAQELGHLVMHRNVRTGNKETEDAANSFARAFLLPRGAFRSEFRELPFSWEHVFELKKRWGTSATTVVARAYDLDLLGAVQYRKAKKHISGKGWTKKEPHERRFQQSSLFEEALSTFTEKAALTNSPQIEEFCQELFFTPATFRIVTGMEISSEYTQTPKLNTTDSRLPTAPVCPDHPDAAPEPVSPYGLDLINQEAKGLFLLRGTDNYELARHSGPQGWALGIEKWHPEYVALPALKMAERLWVVINRSDAPEDNQRFVKSIAADKSIHERARISAVNNTGDMIALFQRVFRDVGNRMFFRWIFEESWHFEPIPLLSHTNKLAELIEPLSPPQPKPIDRGPFYEPQW